MTDEMMDLVSEEPAQPEPAKQKPTAQKRPYTKPEIRTISIDERLEVQTEADQVKNDLLDLVESMRAKKILTDVIHGVERMATGEPVAILYHGSIKVMIPGRQMLELTEPPQDTEEEAYHTLLLKRLGAEVDYIVKGIDQESGIAVASRTEAMAIKRRIFYFPAANREPVIYPGSCAEARVVSTSVSRIFVEVFGVETRIRSNELSYQRLGDASQHFQTGQRVLVKILSVELGDNGKVTVSASVKQAQSNPADKALKMYQVDNCYVGTVSMVDENGVFVALEGGIDCLCGYPLRGRPARGARVTVRIRGKNEETLRIWGNIVRISDVIR